MAMMRYKRGDIVLVLFPNSDLRSAKRRPALVVQADNLNTGLPQIVVAMITSNLVRAGHPSRVGVSLSSASRRQTGLISDSVIVTDNLATIAETEIASVLGIWCDMALLNDALRHTFGL
jgi:mRNA interferase MazF